MPQAAPVRTSTLQYSRSGRWYPLVGCPVDPRPPPPGRWPARPTSTQAEVQVFGRGYVERFAKLHAPRIGSSRAGLLAGE